MKIERPSDINTIPVSELPSHVQTIINLLIGQSFLSMKELRLQLKDVEVEDISEHQSSGRILKLIFLSQVKGGLPIVDYYMNVINDEYEEGE